MDELIGLLKAAGFERVYRRWEKSGPLPVLIVSYDDIDYDRGDISRFPRYRVELLHSYARGDDEVAFVAYAIRVANALWALGANADDWLPGGYDGTGFADPRTEVSGQGEDYVEGYKGKALSAQTFYITHAGYTPGGA